MFPSPDRAPGRSCPNPASSPARRRPARARSRCSARKSSVAGLAPPTRTAMPRGPMIVRAAGGGPSTSSTEGTAPWAAGGGPRTSRPWASIGRRVRGRGARFARRRRCRRRRKPQVRRARAASSRLMRPDDTLRRCRRAWSGQMPVARRQARSFRHKVGIGPQAIGQFLGRIALERRDRLADVIGAVRMVCLRRGLALALASSIADRPWP